MPSFSISSVVANQIEDLQIISRTTFFETFAAHNSEVNMTNYLENNLSKEQLSIELSNPQSVFYFALDAENIIGYLKLNFMNAALINPHLKGIEIARIYVSKKYHGTNAGQLLFDTALSLSKENNCNYLWLGVWENNQRAIRFYEKNGFTINGAKEFLLGDDVQKDFIMAKML